jgi:hypothetical protein
MELIRDVAIVFFFILASLGIALGGIRWRMGE